MAVISLMKFSGVAPRFSPNKLQPDMAQTALNVRLAAGTLASWKQTTTVKSSLSAGPVSTIYRYGQDLVSDTNYWFHWTADVDVVKGAISGDQTERTYFTHPSLGARLTDNSAALTGGSGDYPWNSYPLGVPAPALTPVAVVTDDGDPNEPTETRIYTFTYVTAFGEEGPPSPTSAPLDLKPTGASVTLSGLSTTPPSGYAGYITAKRIYRTLSGSATTEFQLVDEIPISQATYVDSIAGSALNELITTATYNPPPSGGFGLTQMANGIMLMFKGYDVYASEPYLPYAYPTGNQQSVDYPIVGGKAIGTSAVVVTTGHPDLLTGSDPSALALVKLEDPQACSSKRSLASGGGGVFYASPDGLIFITSSGQLSNLTGAFFTRDEWQALNPSSMHGYFHDGRYYGFYNNGSVQRGFIFDPGQGSGAFTFIDTYATAGFVDAVQDVLYLKVGSNIVKWNSGTSRMTYTWRSAIFELTNLGNYAVAQVVAKDYPLTFRLYADGALKHTQTVTSANPFRLPSGYMARFVEIEVEGTTEILAVHVADSMSELKAA